MKKVIFIMFFSLIVSLILLSIDDELTDETKTLIYSQTKTNGSEAFVYALGIFAAVEENPIVVGRSLLQEYQKSEQDESYEINEYPETKKLSLPTGELFCSFRENKCPNILFYSNINIEELIKKHEVLTQRLVSFYNYSEYTTLTKPFVTESLPPLQYISAAARLQLLNAIQTHRNGNSQQALRALNRQLSQLRHVLSLQDTLIGKMLFLHKLSDVVDVMALIHQSSKISIEKIAPLSVAEKSLSEALAREFAMHYNTYESLDGQPELFKKGGNIPQWISRLLYKPNMTINAGAPFFTRLVQVSGFAHIQFVTEIRAGSGLDIPTSSFRNYFGSVLANIAMPSFDNYIARFLDFDAKLVLFNHLDKGIDTAFNPYYENAIPIILADKVCFDGPLEDNHFIRCLRKISKK